MRKHIAAGTVVCMLGTALAQQGSFTLKGRHLGQDSTSACEGSAGISDPLGEFVSRNIASAPGLRDPVSKLCEVPLDSFAGFKPESPMRLLFVKDQLIQAIIPLGVLTWSEHDEVRKALAALYGRPQRDVSNAKDGMLSDNWRTGDQRLSLHSIRGAPGESSVEVVLWNRQLMSQFQQTVDHNSRLLRGNAQKARQADAK